MPVARATARSSRLSLPNLPPISPPRYNEFRGGTLITRHSPAIDASRDHESRSIHSAAAHAMSTDQPIAEPLPEGSSSPSFRFTLRELFILTTFVCVAGGLFAWGAGGEPIALLLFLPAAFGTLAYLIHLLTRWATLTVLLTAGFFTLSSFCLLGPISRGVPQRSAREMSCNNNLRNLLLALAQYESVYGTFPPAFIADDHGKPMHSWRVLLLPYLEQQDLYKLYRFDEPWNGPNNSALHQRRVRIYTCPSDNSPQFDTSYVAVLGPTTAWPGETATKLGDLKDGPSNTILLVEVESSGIHWMEPRDLDLSSLNLAVNSPSGTSISSGHPIGAHVAYADGRVKFISNNTPSKTLRALLTRSGGETVNLP